MGMDGNPGEEVEVQPFRTANMAHLCQRAGSNNQNFTAITAAVSDIFCGEGGVDVISQCFDLYHEFVLMLKTHLTMSPFMLPPANGGLFIRGYAYKVDTGMYMCYTYQHPDNALPAARLAGRAFRRALDQRYKFYDGQ